VLIEHVKTDCACFHVEDEPARGGQEWVGEFPVIEDRVLVMANEERNVMAIEDESAREKIVLALPEMVVGLIDEYTVFAADRDEGKGIVVKYP
jgi:uncharacterized protein YuzE